MIQSNTLKAILIGCITLFITQSGVCQLDNLLRKTTRKLGDRIEQMAIEKLSDIIARKAAEKIEDSFDSWLRQAMEQDSTYNPDDSAYYRLGGSYGQFLKGLNDAADLPSEYRFDLNILAKMTHENDEPENVRLYYSSTSSVFAMQTATSEKESQLIVIDAENDLTVLYQQDGDKKTAQAIPNFMQFAGSMAGQDTLEQFSYTVTPIKKKQKIAGYKCDGYELVNEKNRIETWMTGDLGVSWEEQYGVLMEKFAPGAYSGEFELMKGISLKTDQYSVETGNLTTSIEAQEVNREETIITNADYTFGYEQ